MYFLWRLQKECDGGERQGTVKINPQSKRLEKERWVLFAKYKGDRGVVF